MLDLVSIAIIDCQSSKTGHIQAAMERLQCKVDLILLKDANQCHFQNYQGVIISGGPYLFTDPENSGLIDLFAFIDQLKIPTLGICLGHQAIGIRHSATIFKSVERKEQEKIRIHSVHSLVRNLDSICFFEANHCEGIELPDGFTCLAASAFYGVEMMACDTKPFYGVQFHPEVSGENGVQLFKNFLEIIKSAGSL